MDTRTKILTFDQARALPRPLALAACEFNVLRAEHAAAIERFRRDVPGHALLALVLPVTPELLPARARAELVAALREVQWVLIAGAIEPFDGGPVLRLTESGILAHVRRGRGVLDS